MTKSKFDENKTFQMNCDDFLDDLKSIDAEMAQILIDHWERLATIKDGDKTDTNERSKVNSSVAAKLDELTASSNIKKSK